MINFSNTGTTSKEVLKSKVDSFLHFIYIFRFIFKDQLKYFIKTKLNTKNPYKLFNFCLKNELIVPGSYLEDKGFKNGDYYYLSRKGLEYLSIINNDLPVHRYTFTTRLLSDSKIIHNRYVIDLYVFLTTKFPGSEWVSDWELRTTLKPGDRLPDGVLVLYSGLTLAVELERSRKKNQEWKDVCFKFKGPLSRNLFQGVLIVASNPKIYNGIINRVFPIRPGISDKYFFVSTFDLLNKNQVVYKDETITFDQMMEIVNV